MGIDVDAVLVFGIILPDEFIIVDEENESVWEKLDEIFSPYKGESQYPGLEVVPIGTCDNPEYIVGLKKHIHSVSWGSAEAINIKNLEQLDWEQLLELGAFADEFDINQDAKWYLSSYTSY